MPLPQSPSGPDTYGVPNDGVGFRNYQGLGVVDPTTDQDASAGNQELIDLACLTRTGILARVTFTTDAATPTLVSHQAQYGNGGGVAPVVARTGLGTFTITLPASVTDYLGRTRTIAIGRAWAQIEGSTARWPAQTSSAANVVTVYTFSTAPAANDIAGTNVTVFCTI